MTPFAPTRRPPALALPAAPCDVAGVYWRPSGPFVTELCNWLKGKRVLEIFAGNGYLAAWLAAHDIQVRATTRFSGHDRHEHGLYYPVEEADADQAVLAHGPANDVLLLCWPTVTLAALHAALRWGPDRDIVFIGEVTDHGKGHLGGCATDEFFEAIEIRHRFSSYRGNMLEAAFVCRLRPPAPSR